MGPALNVCYWPENRQKSPTEAGLETDCCHMSKCRLRGHRRGDASSGEAENIFIPHFCGQRCGRGNFESAQRPARLRFLSIARFLSNAVLLSLGMDNW
ncbi:hypothetical protein RCH10_005034 [Variovorax sp. GrIS 2.14]|uniref:hypothetical protein n=1 Tax=Variovorax sp. GrIS 2.14 TaxID=3071709 RepID=UPI0038F6657E